MNPTDDPFESIRVFHGKVRVAEEINCPKERRDFAVQPGGIEWSLAEWHGLKSIIEYVASSLGD